MINATHYIIDLETMGKGSNAAIAAIGCVEIIGGTISREIYRRVELSNSMAAGGTADADTIQWWLSQSAAARAEVNGTQSAELLFNVLGELRVFMTGMAHAHEILVWGNGATFDNVILSNAYAAYGMERPWAYWNDRDLRTLLALYPEAKALPFEGTKHHALDDARHEAKQLILALQCHAAGDDCITDSDMIDWLDREAAYHGEPETGELRFPVVTPHKGMPSLRDILKLAVAQHQEREAL